MKTNGIITLDDGAKILGISKRTLYQRIEHGYYGSIKMGSILLDPESGRPLTESELKSIPIRSKGRQPGIYGCYIK